MKLQSEIEHAECGIGITIGSKWAMEEQMEQALQADSYI